MTRLEQVKQEIEAMSEPERTALEEWLLRREWTDDAWDRQMRTDAAAGKLDQLAQQAIREFRMGQTRECP